MKTSCTFFMELENAAVFAAGAPGLQYLADRGV